MGPKWVLPVLVGWGSDYVSTGDVLLGAGMDVGLFWPEEWWDSALCTKYCMSRFFMSTR
jgi:hypothetical protein